MTFCLKFSLMAFIASITIANCSVLEILEDPKSRCPKYWVDATHVDMVRFSFPSPQSLNLFTDYSKMFENALECIGFFFWNLIESVYLEPFKNFYYLIFKFLDKIF